MKTIFGMIFLLLSAVAFSNSNIPIPTPLPGDIFCSSEQIETINESAAELCGEIVDELALKDEPVSCNIYRADHVRCKARCVNEEETKYKLTVYYNSDCQTGEIEVRKWKLRKKWFQ